MAKPKRCRDCESEGISTSRPVNWPGPRCYTHHRAFKKGASARAHARRTEAVYGITGDDYWMLYEGQGGRCCICRVANGTTKRLAVDHDHDTGEVRGLLCGPCNITIGRLREQGLIRALEYLANPPARRVLSHESHSCYSPSVGGP